MNLAYDRAQGKPISAIDQGKGPAIDGTSAFTYKQVQEILKRLRDLCVEWSPDGDSVRKPREQEQRLLRNMHAHEAAVDLLKVCPD